MPRFFLLCKKPSSLPLIHKSLSSSFSQTLLYSHVDLLLSHFLSYYDALDNAATQENLPELLFRNLSKNLMSQIEQIEGGLRLMVRALVGRIKKGQSDEGLKGVIVEAMKKEMDDTVSVFVYANRLSKCVIVEIVGALNLAQSLVGLSGQRVLGEFNRSKISIS
ncbi:protein INAPERTURATE POLLEN1 [Citrus sinensis]|nr:protein INAPERTURATE POLLEN1 [Citrus sinensis]